MENIGNSNRIAREYLDSLRIETRYMDSGNPVLDFELYGTKAATPIMTAALSHLDHFMYPGAADALARGAKEAGAILWYGMAEEAEIGRLAGYGAPMIEIIKPYTDREMIYRKIRHAEEPVALRRDFENTFCINDIAFVFETLQNVVEGLLAHPAEVHFLLHGEFLEFAHGELAELEPVFLGL